MVDSWNPSSDSLVSRDVVNTPLSMIATMAIDRHNNQSTVITLSGSVDLHSSTPYWPKFPNPTTISITNLM